MKTIRIKQAEMDGKPLPPRAELFVLRAEIEKLEALPVGENVPWGRDNVICREVLLAAYRKRQDLVTKGLVDAGETDIVVNLEVESADAAYSVGIVRIGEDGQPVASQDDLSTAALNEAIQKAEMGSPVLKRLREIIQEANLTPEQAQEFMTKIAQLAAMNRYANMPAEEYHKAADQARVERLAERGFVTPVQPGVGHVSRVHVPEEKPKVSKLERKLQRKQK